MTTTPEIAAGRQLDTPPREGGWQPVRFQWRRPNPLDITEAGSALTGAAWLAGYVPEGLPSHIALGIVASHAVARLAARCVRRSPMGRSVHEAVQPGQSARRFRGAPESGPGESGPSRARAQLRQQRPPSA